MVFTMHPISDAEHPGTGLTLPSQSDVTAKLQSSQARDRDYMRIKGRHCHEPRTFYHAAQVCDTHRVVVSCNVRDGIAIA